MALKVCQPSEFTEHPLVQRVRLLLQEEKLNDTDIVFNNGDEGTLPLSAFLLSLISPVLHRTLCGGFIESENKRLELQEVERQIFVKMLNVACGKEELCGIDEAFEIGKTADRFQISGVVTAVEDVLLNILCVECCAELLCLSSDTGLTRIEEESRRLALMRFEEVGASVGFLKIPEDQLASLLEDDHLSAIEEHLVFEALVFWMKGGGNEVRGERLLKTIRYPLMDLDYLQKKVIRVFPDSQLLNQLVQEATHQKPTDTNGIRHLCANAFSPRIGPCLDWRTLKEECEKLTGHHGQVAALTECRGRICSGSHDGTVRIWDRTSRQVHGVLDPKDGSRIWTLTVWEGRLVSGHGLSRARNSGSGGGSGDCKALLRVWDILTGQCLYVMEGHSESVRALVAKGTRLVSGSDDGSLRVWRECSGPAAAAPECEVALAGNAGGVRCLCVWRNWVASGGCDAAIHVWDLRNGRKVATLAGHKETVVALAAQGGRLYSSSSDRTLRMWKAGTWEALKEVCACDGGHFLGSLAVAPPMLLAGTASRYGVGSGELQVWDLDVDKRQRILRLQKGSPQALTASAGKIWGGAGNEVAVWSALSQPGLGQDAQSPKPA